MDASRTVPGTGRAAPALGRAAALVCAALACAAACGRDGGGGGVSGVAGLVRDTVRGRPVLRIEAREFFNADFRAYLEATGAAAKGLPDESLSRLFDRFVDEAVLLEAARARGIAVSEDERKEHLARQAVEDIAPDRPEAAGAEAAEAAFDRLLVEKYTFLVVRDVAVGEDEVLAYYEQHKKDFLHRGRVRVSQILVDTEEKAVSVLRRLDRAGEAEFRAIAAEESLGPEAAKGGVMGVFEHGDLPADMEKVIFSLDEGRTSQVVESAYGFHVFRLDEKQAPALRTADEAAPEIRRRLTAQKMKDALSRHLAGLKETLSWEARAENLFFPYQRMDE